MAPIHVKYPNFKEAVQSIAHDLNGRTDKGRSSATVYLGASTWAMIAERLADAAYMAKLGGVVPASVKCTVAGVVCSLDGCGVVGT